MLSGPSRLQYHSDLALHLFEIHFEPNGGNNETFAFFNDTETIKKNIPEEIQIVQKQDVDFIQSPEPEQKTIPDPGLDENQPKKNDVLEENPGINALTDGSRYEEEGRTVKGDHEVAPATNTLTDSSRYEEKGQIVKDDQEKNPGSSAFTGGSRNKGNRQNGKRNVYRID